MWRRGHTDQSSTRRTNRVERSVPESFSYYRSSRRNQTIGDVRRQEQEAAEKHDVMKLLKLSVVGLVVIAALAKLLFVSAAPKVIIPEDNNIYRSAEAYQAIVAKAIADSPWHGSKLTFDDAAVRRSLAESLPELASAEIIIPLINNRPIIKLEFQKPGVILRSKNTSYVVTTSGRVAVPKSAQTKGVAVPLVEDLSGVTYAEGDYGLAASAVSFIAELQHQLTTKDITVTQMTVPSGSIAELHLKVRGEAYYVRFDMTGDPAVQAGNFIASKGELSRLGLLPKEYIDARVTGKVFVK